MVETKVASNDDKNSSKILQSGDVIKPEIDDETVKALAERLYGISCLELKELNGYDDKNYKITEDTNMKNPLITKHCPYGYVLKIMNSMDSEKLSLVEAQTEIMLFLGELPNCFVTVLIIFISWYRPADKED